MFGSRYRAAGTKSGAILQGLPCTAVDVAGLGSLSLQPPMMRLAHAPVVQAIGQVLGITQTPSCPAYPVAGHAGSMLWLRRNMLSGS